MRRRRRRDGGTWWANLIPHRFQAPPPEQDCTGAAGDFSADLVRRRLESPAWADPRTRNTPDYGGGLVWPADVAPVVSQDPIATVGGQTARAANAHRYPT